MANSSSRGTQIATSQPQPLDGERVRAALAQVGIAWPVIWFARTDSTNDEARRWIAHDAEDGTVVLADEQTAGRGRLDRAWFSPPGSGLWLSIIFRPDLAVDRSMWLPMIVSLAAVEAIEQVTGLKPVVKWPNDLLLPVDSSSQTGMRKLAGLLTEVSFQGDQLEWAVVGIGLNVNTDFSDRPELAKVATSLSTALGRPVDRLDLLVALLLRLDSRYRDLRAGQSPVPDWAARLVTLGRSVKVQLPTGSVEGLAEGVDADGALRVRRMDGKQVRVTAGDVS